MAHGWYFLCRTPQTLTWGRLKVRANEEISCIVKLMLWRGSHTKEAHAESSEGCGLVYTFLTIKGYKHQTTDIDTSDLCCTFFVSGRGMHKKIFSCTWWVSFSGPQNVVWHTSDSIDTRINFLVSWWSVITRKGKALWNWSFQPVKCRALNWLNKWRFLREQNCWKYTVRSNYICSTRQMTPKLPCALKALFLKIFPAFMLPEHGTVNCMCSASGAFQWGVLASEGSDWFRWLQEHTQL